MKTIILSAGQGRRLLPKTAHAPKCTLTVGDRSVIEWQIDTLLENGVDSITVVAGYGAKRVRALLEERYDTRRVRTLYNSLFEVGDNLVSCWTARREMNEDFILLNGDTLFEPAVLEMLLSSPVKPVTLATNFKASYDADDMKVQLDGNRLARVGKTLPPDQIHGESMGMMLFRGQGGRLFRAALERMIRKPEAFKQWYLSVIDTLAQSGLVWTQSMRGLEWTEIDDLADLEHAQAVVPRWAQRQEYLQMLA